MERLDQLASYFKEKERKRLNETNKDNLGLPEMSPQGIRFDD